MGNLTAKFMDLPKWVRHTAIMMGSATCLTFAGYRYHRIHNYPYWLKDRNHFKILANYGPSGGWFDSENDLCVSAKQQFWYIASDESPRMTINRIQGMFIEWDDYPIHNPSYRSERIADHNKVAKELQWTFPGRSELVAKSYFTLVTNRNPRSDTTWIICAFEYKGRTRVEISERTGGACMGG